MQTVSQPAFWKLLWEYHLDDVSTTLRLAARRVIWDDPSGDDDDNNNNNNNDVRFRRQQQRAHALWILGNAFQNVAADQKQPPQQQQVTDYNASSILEMVQAAFMASIPMPQET